MQILGLSSNENAKLDSTFHHKTHDISAFLFHTDVPDQKDKESSVKVKILPTKIDSSIISSTDDLCLLSLGESLCQAPCERIDLQKTFSDVLGWKQ